MFGFRTQREFKIPRSRWKKEIEEHIRYTVRSLHARLHCPKYRALIGATTDSAIIPQQSRRLGNHSEEKALSHEYDPRQPREGKTFEQRFYASSEHGLLYVIGVQVSLGEYYTIQVLRALNVQLLPILGCVTTKFGSTSFYPSAFSSEAYHNCLLISTLFPFLIKRDKV